MPLRRQLLVLDAEHAARSPGTAPPDSNRLVEHRPDDAVAPASGDVRPEGLAPAIREVLGVVELIESTAACPSSRAASRIHIAVCGSTWPIDRYSAMPSTNHSGRRSRPLRVAPSCWLWLGDVVLERVHQLVPEHVVGFRERPEHRHHDPPPQSFGHAAGAFADAGHDVGLAEVRTRRVENERLRTREIVLQDLRQARVPALRHPRGLFGGGARLGVEVHLEMLGGDHLELELFVLDLVAAEVLSRRGWRRRQCECETRIAAMGTRITWSTFTP